MPKLAVAEEVLGHGAPQVPQRLDRGVLLTLDEGLRIESQQLAESAQEAGGAVQADRRLQIGALQRLAQQAAVLAVHADVDMSIGQRGTSARWLPSGKHQVDLGANALDQAADLGQVRRHVEVP
jgi:hypothetical protein